MLNNRIKGMGVEGWREGLGEGGVTGHLTKELMEPTRVINRLDGKQNASQSPEMWTLRTE